MDFAYRAITVRRGKGDKDRVVMLPDSGAFVSFRPLCGPYPCGHGYSSDHVRLYKALIKTSEI